MGDEELFLEEIKDKIKKCLKKVYDEDPSLIEKYDICERSIMHRFALYLQEEFQDYWVDCEFNKQSYGGEISPKILSSLKGNYVDIIIHGRENKPDFLCFEIKKSNNYYGRDNDREKLKILTSCKPESFQYKYGFFIIFYKKFEKSKYEIFKKGNLIEEGRISNL